MLIKRTANWLLAWGALVSLAGWALAQPPANSNLDYQTPTPSYENGSAQFSNANPSSRSFLPFNPVNFEPSLRLFGPAETSGYGNGPRPHIGFFASYERLYWSFSKPSFAVIGSETAVGPSTNGALFQFPPPSPNNPGVLIFPAINSADTGFLLANGAWGNRFELGYVDTDNYGWLASILDHVSQGQFHKVTNAQVQFNDPNGLLTGYIPNPLTDPALLGTLVRDGKMQTLFNEIDMKNVTTLNGVELMRMYRPGRLHDGGYFELLYGARYLQLADTFYVIATNIPANSAATTGTTTTTAIINPLSDSTWGTRVQNNLIGPQIGARWSRQRGHWVTSFEGRFLAAANVENAHQKTNLGTMTAMNVGMLLNSSTSPLPASFAGLGTNTHLFNTTFAPLGELRVQTAYHVTNNTCLKVGYTGLVMGGISRASNRIDYSGPNLISIKNGDTNQIFFSNGVSFGVEINR